MNREQAKILLSNIEMIKAFADGAEMQYGLDNKWYNENNLSFTGTDTLYRIKPVPLEGWGLSDKLGNIGCYHPTRESAECAARYNVLYTKVVHMREVVE